jgi:hypothetical protein
VSRAFEVRFSQIRIAQVIEENVGILQFGFLQVTVAQICTTQLSALKIRLT